MSTLYYESDVAENGVHRARLNVRSSCHCPVQYFRTHCPLNCETTCALLTSKEDGKGEEKRNYIFFDREDGDNNRTSDLCKPMEVRKVLVRAVNVTTYDITRYTSVLWLLLSMYERTSFVVCQEKDLGCTVSVYRQDVLSARVGWYTLAQHDNFWQSLTSSYLCTHTHCLHI